MNCPQPLLHLSSCFFLNYQYPTTAYKHLTNVTMLLTPLGSSAKWVEQNTVKRLPGQSQGSSVQVFFLQRCHARNANAKHRWGEEAGRLASEMSVNESSWRPGLERSQRMCASQRQSLRTKNSKGRLGNQIFQCSFREMLHCLQLSFTLYRVMLGSTGTKDRPPQDRPLDMKMILS